MLGGNPVYQAPADLRFGEALQKTAFSVHLGLHADETSALTTWHAPAAHFLESWGDVSGNNGAGIVQPLIAPLFDGKSSVELLGLILGKDDQSGYDLVQETWKGMLGAGGFEKKWRRVVHDGYTTLSREKAIRINKSKAADFIAAGDFNASSATPEKMEAQMNEAGYKLERLETFLEANRMYIYIFRIDDTQ